MSSITIKRLALELRMRRRRLNFFQRPEPWRGKEIARRAELIWYDRHLVLAAEMLEVAAPDLPAHAPLAPDLRAALEDRLAMAGLDVFAPPRQGLTGDVIEDGDLFL